jgi:outer membrane protein
MKRLFLLFFVLIPVIASAQIQFGYLSYQQVLKEMPEYAQAMQELQTLKAKYDEEAARGEAEFQKKFVDFLQGQKDFPQSIMQKRQAELQTLMDNGVAFRVQVQGLIAQAEKDLVAEVQKKLNRVLLEVGVEYGYGYILNTDDNACPYINPVVGVDVTELVRQKLGLTAPSQDDQNE